MASGNEKLQLDITAKDDASKTVDGLQKKVDKLETGKTTLEFEADTDGAASDVDSFAKKLERLTAEDQVVLLALKAAGVESELAGLYADVSQLDAADPTIEVKVDRIAELGGELEGLKAKIVDIGDTPIDQGGLGGSLDGVRGKLSGVHSEADNSRSVLANMVGNSAQDLGELSGVAGTAGLAIGQMAEYAADGNINLAGLAKVAGPMGGLAAVTYLVSNHMKAIAETKAFHKDEVDAYVESIRGGKDAAQDLVDRLTEAGKVLGESKLSSANELLGFSDAVVDVTDKLNLAGLTVEQYSQLVTGSKEDVLAWAESQKDAGANGKDLFDVLGIITDAQKDYRTATKNAETSTKFFGDEAGRAEQAQKDLKAATEAVARKLDEQSAAFDGLRTNIQDDQAWIDLQAQFDAIGSSSDASKTDVNNLKLAVIDYGQQVNGLPPAKVTEILAKIDGGDIASAEAQLATLTRNRTISIDIQTRGGAGYDIKVSPRDSTRGATGGIITQEVNGVTLGEAGPEAVIPLNRAPGASPLPGGLLGGGGPMTVNINMPVGSNGDDVVRAIKRYERTNGSGWRS